MSFQVKLGQEDAQTLFDLLCKLRQTREQDARENLFGSQERESALNDCCAIYRAQLCASELAA